MGFWIAIAAGSMMLIDFPSSPLMSLVDAGLLFSVASGIRRGRWWAAVMGSYLMMIPVLALAMRPDRSLLQVGVVGTVCLTAAFLMLRTAARLRASSGKGVEWPWVAATAFVIAATLFLRPMVLPTASMADTLQAGDRFFMETISCRLGGDLSRGDLVVFRYPPDRRQTFVKRVVGVPGDRLHIKDKVLYRNGVPVPETYAFHKAAYVDSFRDNFPSAPNVVLGAGAEAMLSLHVMGEEVVVPDGHYFVLGDNRDNSLDSRYWGFVSREDVIGRPFLLYASKSSRGFWPRLLTRS